MLEISNTTNTLHLQAIWNSKINNSTNGNQKITFIHNYNDIYFSYELKYGIHTPFTNVCNLFGYAK